MLTMAMNASTAMSSALAWPRARSATAPSVLSTSQVAPSSAYRPRRQAAQQRERRRPVDGPPARRRSPPDALNETSEDQALANGRDGRAGGESEVQYFLLVTATQRNSNATPKHQREQHDDDRR
jgi:hypothetical protein